MANDDFDYSNLERKTTVGTAKPCRRCGSMVECPTDGVVFVHGQVLTGPQCDDCFELMLKDSRVYWDGFPSLENKS